MCVVACRACGNATWSLHTDGDDERWCHREPMSDTEAAALRAARREQEALLAAEAARVAAAAPTPREVLAAVVDELTGAQAELVRLEARWRQCTRSGGDGAGCLGHGRGSAAGGSCEARRGSG
jgi:hypothetical protein